MAQAPDCELLIAGGGHAGLSLAVACRQAAPDLSVTVIDPRPATYGGDDLRASAIAAAAVRLLDALGVWRDIADEAEPIRSMVITDSRTSDPVRPVFLTFSGEVGPGEPFAHMVPNELLTAALARRARGLGVGLISGDAVNDFKSGPHMVDVRLRSGRALRTRLLVAADGRRSRLRALAGIPVYGWEYGQAGIVATVAHERPHEGRAEEHFLPAGPFAVLPLKGNRASLVWTEEKHRAAQLVSGDDFTFEIELERRFGHRLGPIRPVGPRQAFPLEFTIARRFVAHRLALVGDAAHGIHPIAGQGLNLGFRDVAALAEGIVETHRLGLDIGAADVLEGYERWRRFDTAQMAIVCDGLNRLFSTDLLPVRAIRDLGLGLVDRFAPLKRFMIRDAAGLAGAVPRLLRGEAL